MEYRQGAVTLTYLYNDFVKGAFMDSVMRFATSDHGPMVFGPDGGGTISISSGPRIATARNTLVQKFLEGPGEWMWMIDTDHTFAPDALAKLMAAADPAMVPVLGGLCYGGGRGGTVTPTMFRFNEEGKDMRLLTPTSGRGGLVQVNATGAAFLLVHRFVLEAIQNCYGHKGGHIWFAEGVNAETGAEIGEDVFFCVRAQKAAQAPIFVHTGVEAPHIKNYIIDSSDSDEFEANLAKYGEDVIRERHLGKLRGEVGTLDEWAARMGVKAQVEPQLNREQRRAAERKKR